jgi:hypothetical protein
VLAEGAKPNHCNRFWIKEIYRFALLVFAFDNTASFDPRLIADHITPLVSNFFHRDWERLQRQLH